MSVMIVVLTILTSALANDLEFNYQVREGQARFSEKIKANLERNTVTYHTPPHNDVVESYKIMDFNKKMQITCLPSLKQCRLRNIDVKEMTDDTGTVAESFLHSWENAVGTAWGLAFATGNEEISIGNGGKIKCERGLVCRANGNFLPFKNKGDNSIDSDRSIKVNERYYIDDEEVTNTVKLGEDLRKFYEKYGTNEKGEGFPLFKEKKLPENAVLLNITSSGDKRTRRSVTTLNNNCNGQTPQKKYGVNTGKSCNYLKICKNAVRRGGQMVFADCNNVHITSPFVYVCVCCPWVTVINTNDGNCACTKMGA